MTERITELVLDESKWLPFALLVSIVVVAVRTHRAARSESDRFEVRGAMNLFYGCMIGVMACGHLLAVTVSLSRGRVPGSSVLFLYGLGLALAVPAIWLAFHAARAGRLELGVHATRGSAAEASLNAWLGVLLLALGPHNWPLALPAALNLGYTYTRRRAALGWTIVAIAIVSYAVLLVGSLIFAASGQSFEQFSGME